MKCENCQTEFEPTNRGGSPQRFCSARCRRQAWSHPASERDSWRGVGTPLREIDRGCCTSCGGPRGESRSSLCGRPECTRWANVGLFWRLKGDGPQSESDGWKCLRQAFDISADADELRYGVSAQGDILALCGVDRGQIEAVVRECGGDPDELLFEDHPGGLVRPNPWVAS